MIFYIVVDIASVSPTLRFKERLRTRFLKSRKPGDLSKALQGGQWTFVQDGLDDFRDGLPPRVDGQSVYKVNLFDLLSLNVHIVQTMNVFSTLSSLSLSLSPFKT